MACCTARGEKQVSPSVALRILNVAPCRHCKRPQKGRDEGKASFANLEASLFGVVSVRRGAACGLRGAAIAPTLRI
jgi:hypothetical protein